MAVIRRKGKVFSLSINWPLILVVALLLLTVSSHLFQTYFR